AINHPFCAQPGAIGASIPHVFRLPHPCAHVRTQKVLRYRVYRLENWNRRRAPRWPYFLRSFMRESRVSALLLRSAASSVGSYLSRARARPMTIAPACPVWPPPLALTSTSILPPVLVTSSGPKIALRSTSLVK